MAEFVPYVPPSTEPTGGGGGFHLPNAGGIKFFQQLAQGMFHLPWAAYSALPGGTKSELPAMARGFGTALGDVASTVAKPIGIPGTDWNLADKLVEPGVEALTGTKPQDLLEMSRHQGVLRALGNQIGTVAAFAAPVAGIAGKAAKAGTAAEVAALDAAAAGTGTAEAATAASTAAQQAARVANIAHDFAHPYIWAGKQFGGLTKAAREATLASDVATAGVTAATKNPVGVTAFDNPTDPAMVEQMRAALDVTPETAAAATATPIPAATPDPAALKYGAEGRIPLEHLTPGNELRHDITPLTGSEEPIVIQMHDGEYRVVEGNHRVEAARQSGAKDIAFKSEPRPTSLGMEDAPVEPTIGPHSDVNPNGPGKPLTAAQEAERARETAIHEAEQAAKDGPYAARKSAVAGQVAERINLAPPKWATDLVNRLPPSANRVLANFPGAARMEHWRLHNVVRDYERLAEAAHRSGMRSPAVEVSKQAGATVLAALPELDAARVSHIVAEDIGAHLDGTMWVEEHVKRGGNPTLERNLRDAARRNYRGLTDEMRAKMSPEQQAAYDSQIQQAVVAWRQQADTRLQTMLASRKGSQGIEMAVLGENGPTMTPKMKRDYQRAVTAMRREAMEKLRGASMREKQGARLERERALTDEKATSDARNAREKVGVETRTMEDARQGVAKSIRPNNVEGVIDTFIASVLNGDGVVWNVGRATIHEGEGIVVPVGTQLDVPIGELLTPEGRQALKDAMENPTDIDGNQLGPSVWNGPDAKLVVEKYVVPEGPNAGETFVRVKTALASIGGEDMAQWQAEMLGEAYGNETLNLPGGGETVLSGRESTQNLYAHYLPQIMDPGSDLARFANEAEKTADAVGISHEAVQAEMRFTATLDYNLNRAHPNDHALGDYFKQAAIESAKGAPSKYNFLAQTVAHVLYGEEISNIEQLDLKTLHTALSWYYDSHDYIESNWRGKTIKLLNGEERDAAEVFYDLLAVTSVQASPTQNFGRALMAMSNMDEFLQTQKHASLVALELMNRLEESPNTSSRIIDVGQDTERLATYEESLAGKGTDVSDRFLDPDVRKMLDQTAMATKPKYNVFDVLSGRLKLDGNLTAETLEENARWWDTKKRISPASMARSHVTKWLDLNGTATPAADAYREWVVRRDRVVGYHQQIESLKKANPEMSKADIARDVLAGNEDGISNQAQLTRARQAVLKEEKGLLKDAEVRKAYESALMEHQGSSGFAKLRSFRSNLSNPAESMAVTLDSVMGRMWGFNSQQWDKVGFYTEHADRVRQIADELSVKWGRTVKPHEVQAALWVMTKRKIGQQDWGRWLGHHSSAQDWLDKADEYVNTPRNDGLESFIDQPETYDPFGAAWDEELGYSRHAADVRVERGILRKLVKAKKASPEEVARLAELEQLDVESARPQQVQVTKDAEALHPEAEITPQMRPTLAEETRWSMPFDAKKLTAKEEQYQRYVEARAEMRKSLAEGDFEKLRKQVTEYALSRRKSIIGSQEGGAFNVTAEEQLAKLDDAGNSTRIAWERLQNAKAVPAPRPWKSNFISSVIARWNREHGLPAPEGIDTTAVVDPAKTEAVANAVQDLLDRQARGEITPEEAAAATESYNALKTHIDEFYTHMTQELGVQVEYVAPDQEYGLGTLGDDPQPDVASAHAELVHDVRANNHLKIRGTELAGDGPNAPMAEVSPTHGLMYNDMLRAIHDFAGHAQAANDFGRNGENIAQMLHLQMVDEAAKPALITEFRAQTAYLVQTGSFMEDQLAHLLPEEMQGSHYMLHDDVEGLQQKNMGDLRGLLLDQPDKHGRLTMRMFKNADLSTLMHESGHLLRRILPDESLAAVEGMYPHILDELVDGKYTPARVSAEEAFVRDMFMYMHSKTRPLSGPMSDVFEKLGNTIEGEFNALMETEHGAALTDEVVSFWDKMLHNEVDPPSEKLDPISLQADPGGVGTEIHQYHWESDADFATRDRQYGEARQRVSEAKSKARHYEKLERQVHASSQKMLALFNKTPNYWEAKAAASGKEAGSILERLAKEMGDPSTGQVPAEWQPMWEAWQSLAEHGKRNPMMAEMLDEIPENFQAMLKSAAERGFEPTHMPEMTWDKAIKTLFGHVSFADKAHDVGTSETAGTRKVRTGMLSHHGLADRSIEAFAAGMQDVTRELYKNEVVNFIEQNWARENPVPGQKIPDGWQAWDGDRAAIFSGEKFESPGKQTLGTTKIIPKAVGDAIRSMSNPYDHWAFHSLTRNPAYKVWRTALLTLSPKWYINNVFGNIMLATVEGVRLKDWTHAIREWKAGDVPFDVPTSNSLLSILEDGESQGLISRPYKEASKVENAKKVKLLWKHTQHRLVRINESVDEIARAAVYQKTLRSTGSRELALTRAHSALVDYNDLSPVERGAVRAIVPFYSWQKGIFKLLTKFPSDHPLATELALMAGQVHEEMLQDKFGGPIPDAYLGLEANMLHPDQLVQTRSINPFLDGVQLISPRGIAGSLNPFVDALARDAYASPEFGTELQRLSPTGQSERGVDYSKALGQSILSFPQVRLGQNLTGHEDVFGKQPTDVAAITNMLGGLKGFSEEDILKIKDRIAQAEADNATLNAGGRTFERAYIPKDKPK